VNAATLAGHVTIEDFTTIGALSPVHQFCRVGSYAYIGASTVGHYPGCAAIFKNRDGT